MSTERPTEDRLLSTYVCVLCFVFMLFACCCIAATAQEHERRDDDHGHWRHHQPICEAPPVRVFVLFLFALHCSLI